MASMFLVELDCFSHDNFASLLDIVTECFSEFAALLRSNCFLCIGSRYLLMLPLGLSLAYFGCHVLALHVEESLEVTILAGG